MTLETAAVVMEAAARALHDRQHEWHYSERNPNEHYARNEAFIHVERGNVGISGFLLETVVPFIRQTILYTIIGTLCFCSSCIMCCIIYWLIMPSSYVTEPVFFDYHYQGQCTSMNRILQRQQNLGRLDIKEEFECPPTAVVNVHHTHTQWYAHSDDVTPPLSTTTSFPTPNLSTAEHSYLTSVIHRIYSHERNDIPSYRLLTPRRPYFIQVAITLPESVVNRNLGMFMIDVDLKDTNQRYLASSSRSAVFPYESNYVSAVRKSLLMAPLLIGALQETRTVVVECFDHYIESVDRPLESIEIRLVMPHKAHFSKTGQSIQVVDAELRIGKELNQVQKLIKEWFYTYAFVTIFFLLIAHAVFVLVLQVFYDQHVSSTNRRRSSSYEESCISYDNDEFHYDQSQKVDDYSILSGSQQAQSSNRSENDYRQDMNETNDDLSGEWEPTTPHLNTAGDQKSQLERQVPTRKKGTLSKVKISSTKQEEKIKVDKVMKGDFEPYHIFTDLDDPD